MIGIGLYYKTGYFRQQLSSDGRQLEFYPENHWYDLPMNLVTDAEGNGVKLKMMLGPSEEVTYQIWKAKVGRTPLSLDTNVGLSNPSYHRKTL